MCDVCVVCNVMVAKVFLQTGQVMQNKPYTTNMCVLVEVSAIRCDNLSVVNVLLLLFISNGNNSDDYDDDVVCMVSQVTCLHWRHTHVRKLTFSRHVPKTNIFDDHVKCP